MPAHFARYVSKARSPGVILLRESIPVATAIEELVLVGSASEAEEWVDPALKDSPLGPLAVAR